MTPILANIGIPMLFPQVFLMGIAFVPVVIIETYLVRCTINMTLSRALKDLAIANLWTTLLGVPLAWMAMLLLEIITTGGSAWGLNSSAKMLAAVTLQAAWLIPYEANLFWMFPCAATVLLVPCFVLSVIIERSVLARRWKETERQVVFSTILRANTWSYIFLLVAGCMWIIINAT